MDKWEAPEIDSKGNPMDELDVKLLRVLMSEGAVAPSDAQVR